MNHQWQIFGDRHGEVTLVCLSCGFVWKNITLDRVHGWPIPFCPQDEADGGDDDRHDLIMRQSDLLTGVVNAVKGPPPELTIWSHHDAVELVQELVRGRLPHIMTMPDGAAYPCGCDLLSDHGPLNLSPEDLAKVYIAGVTERAEEAEKELRARELHHFETEQALASVLALLDAGDLDAGRDVLRGVLGEVRNAPDALPR